MGEKPGIEHHADFAVPITHRLMVHTSVPRSDGVGNISGQAIALGWWQDPSWTDPDAATGTLYLIVDGEQDGPPVWIAEGNIESCQVTD